ncbi:amino acid ABC transporter substrate-binding protein [Prosthecomicrobium sp. N25]|uniref:amino acid ABC transporter substrate-binding protein n=1 Tax=Prosthecomicrobium sp. N25 TaxID=3129254 RepID=UPI0030777DF4
MAVLCLLAGLAPAAAGSPTVDAVRARGHLVCGVNEGLLGFAAQDPSGTWRGFDADFCRAVSVAVLGKDTDVVFVPLGTANRFEALKSGSIDLLARNTTWTMQRQVTLGFDFAGASFFDGQGFIARADRGLTSAQQLAGLKVCVVKGTTTETNMAYYFRQHGLAAETRGFDGRDAMLAAYKAGDCDAYSGDRSALFADRAGFEAPQDHAVLPEVISKEPLGPLVRAGDRTWSEVVRWTLYGLVNAEEVGLTRATAAAPLAGDAARLAAGADASGADLGLAPGWLPAVVRNVGNYGEIFERNVGEAGPLGMKRGLNALWSRGGILYAPPMW